MDRKFSGKNKGPFMTDFDFKIITGAELCITSPTISIDYFWIISEIERRLGYIPADVKDCLLEMNNEKSTS
jgi:hypothetical protein